jgi:hypothetical protein
MSKHIRIKIKRTAFYRSSLSSISSQMNPSCLRLGRKNFTSIKWHLRKLSSFSVNLLGGLKKMATREPVTRKNPKSLKAKHCVFNGKTFDSKSEKDFYLRLCSIFGTQNVETQVPLTLIYSHNLNVPSIMWMCDFCVNLPHGKVYVEFKGTLNTESYGTREFLLKWKLIKGLNSPLRILCFVSGSKSPTWRVENGKVSIPDIHPLSLYEDDELEQIISSQI